MQDIGAPFSDVCKSDEQQTILVGIDSSRSELRVGILLKTLSDYRMEKMVEGDDIDDLIESATLVIGSGSTALNAVLHSKPLIVVGGYGSGGLLTMENLFDQYNNGFKGRIGGQKDEYFSLEELEKEIEKVGYLTWKELQSMSNQIAKHYYI